MQPRSPERALRNAIYEDDVSACVAAIRAGAPPDTLGDGCLIGAIRNALHVAAQRGDAPAIRELAALGVPYLWRDDASPLCLAAASGRTDAMLALLDLGAAPDEACGRFGITAMHQAAWCYRTESIRCLAAYGATVCAPCRGPRRLAAMGPGYGELPVTDLCSYDNARSALHYSDTLRALLDVRADPADVLAQRCRHTDCAATVEKLARDEHPRRNAATTLVGLCELRFWRLSWPYSAPV